MLVCLFVPVYSQHTCRHDHVCIFFRSIFFVVELSSVRFRLVWFKAILVSTVTANSILHLTLIIRSAVSTLVFAETIFHRNACFANWI